MDVTKSKAGELPQRADAAGAEAEPTRSRKPYRKPAFRCERVFETTALACGKVSDLQKHCRFGQKKTS